MAYNKKRHASTDNRYQEGTEQVLHYYQIIGAALSLPLSRSLIVKLQRELMSDLIQQDGNQCTRLSHLTHFWIPLLTARN